MQFGAGTDNPYFDLRRPGDPGGIGYYRVNTQVALLNSARTTCTLGMQAVTPSGIQFAGDGWTHRFVSGLQCLPRGHRSARPSRFRDQERAHLRWGRLAVLQRTVQYGVALQRPLLTDGPEGLRNLFFTVGAMGQLRPDRDGLRPVPNYDVLPGMQWHVNDNCWLSSAVLVPLGPVHAAPGQWQLTCSLQF